MAELTEKATRTKLESCLKSAISNEVLSPCNLIDSVLINGSQQASYWSRLNKQMLLKRLAQTEYLLSEM